MHSRGEAGFLEASVTWLQIDGGEIRDKTHPDVPNETAYVLSLLRGASITSNATHAPGVGPGGVGVLSSTLLQLQS